MEQFSLDKWLQDKSRKVVTRDGRPVRIVCWDLPGEYKIIGVTNESDDGYTVLNKKIDGTGEIPNTKNDIFFADEEEKLDEFEKEVAEAYEWAKTTEREEFVNEFAPKLLDLARKELKKEMIEALHTEYEKGRSDVLQEFPRVGDTKAYQEGIKEGRRLERQDIDKELDEAYKSRDEVVYLEGYDKGYEDALKPLPKFKKATENKEFDKHVLLFEDEERVVLTTELYKDEYYIELDDLKTLPKEE